MSAEIESPCTGVCKLDPSQVCLGCLRSIDEIIAWPAADADIRKRILRAVRSRRDAREREKA